jgi:drug/metabolite transporter (DMT)-like permease
MLRGVTLGILVQCISVVGYLMIANVTSIKSEVFRTGLMIAFAGIVALIAMGYTVLSGQQRLAAVRARDYVYIAIGSILVMFVAQVIYFFGVQATSLTTLAYTMLAFPIISLIAELLLGRVKLSSLGVHDLVGFALLVAGYVAIVSKPLSE